MATNHIIVSWKILLGIYNTAQLYASSRSFYNPELGSVLNKTRAKYQNGISMNTSNLYSTLGVQLLPLESLTEFLQILDIPELDRSGKVI